MKVICPQCASSLGDDDVGRVYRCRHCGEVFRVGEDTQRQNNAALEAANSGNEGSKPLQEEEHKPSSKDPTDSIIQDSSCNVDLITTTIGIIAMVLLFLPFVWFTNKIMHGVYGMTALTLWYMDNLGFSIDTAQALDFTNLRPFDFVVVLVLEMATFLVVAFLIPHLLRKRR